MISRLPRPLPRIVAAPKPAAPAPTAPLPTIALEDIEYDEDGRRILTAPLAAPFRAVPTIMPPPLSRSLPRPVKYMSSAEAAEARAKAGGVFPRSALRADVTKQPVVVRKPTKPTTFCADDVPVDRPRRT